MNPISKNLTIGTLGELLVQLRLLQFDVQAAPPLKDSGNDLIAIRGEAILAIQVIRLSCAGCEKARRISSRTLFGTGSRWGESTEICSPATELPHVLVIDGSGADE